MTKTRLLLVTWALMAAALSPAWAGSLGKTPLRYEDGKGITPPKLIEKVAPVYPPEAREAGIAGKVVLEARVGVDGAVGDVTVVESPDARLSRAAEDAIRKWVFEPARDKAGVPVEVLYSVTVAFRLE